MTGGYALHLHGLFDSVVSDVFADDVNSEAANAGNLCGGFWFDGVRRRQHVRSARLLDAELRRRRARQLGAGRLGGTQARSAATSAARLVSGTAVSTASSTAFHMAGGIGGLRCDSRPMSTTIWYGVLIDNAVTAAANREFNQGSTCAFDTNQNAGVLVNDTLASRRHGRPGGLGSLDAGGARRSSSRPGPAGDVEMQRRTRSTTTADRACTSQDTTAHVLVSSATSINGNGTTLGGNTACTAWQAANPGHGYGIEASVATSNMWSTASPFGNSAGSYNANTGLSGSRDARLRLRRSPRRRQCKARRATQARFNVNQVGGGNSAILAFQENQNRRVYPRLQSVRKPVRPQRQDFRHRGFLAFAHSGRQCGRLGEGPASTLTVNANFVADYLATFDCLTTVTAAAGAQARLNINQIGGGNGAVLGFQNGGTDEWTLGNNSTGNMFSINDKTTGAAIAWLALSAGGNCDARRGDRKHPNSSRFFGG